MAVDLLPVQDAYSGLLVEALVALARRARTQFGTDGHSAKANALRQALGDSDGLSARLGHTAHAPLVELATVPVIDERIGGEALRRFLLSSDARDIALGVLLAQVIGDDSPLEDALRNRFVLAMAWSTRRNQADVEVDADRLFTALKDQLALAINTALGRAAGRTTLSDLQRRDIEQAASAIVADSLTAFRNDRSPDFDAIHRFVEQLRKNAASRLGRIEPPNYVGAGTISLSDLYVEPAFRTERELERRTLSEVSQSIYRTVVLGSPGAGKSSYARAICHSLAAAGLASADSSVPVPFLVELRDYGVFRQANRASILDFLERLVRTDYQTHAPEHAIEFLLSCGRAVVVFDGLDELINTHDRRAIRSDVESFAQRYPFSKVLVTSREVGYREAPLDSREFDVLRIQEFDVPRVERYVRKWFALDTSLTLRERQARTDGFLEESASLPDLRGNPLLLALMCSIYRRRGYIPRNRISMYEECALMIYERWDRGRKIDVDRPLDAHFTPALEHVAQWIYEDSELQSGASHADLTAVAAAYIEEEVIDDPVRARAVADRFVAFCSGRGWVLTESGTTAEGDPLYGFVHRTFLEYFAARWYAHSDWSVTDLAARLLPRLERGEWDVVGLLAVQMRNRSSRGSANDFLQLLLERSDAAIPSRRLQLLVFAARTFEFLVPHPRVTRPACRGRPASSLGTAKRYRPARGRQRLRAESQWSQGPHARRRGSSGTNSSGIRRCDRARARELRSLQPGQSVRSRGAREAVPAVTGPPRSTPTARGHRQCEHPHCGSRHGRE
ncbi:NACHT domain-containing protein [Svornostia abyssi]|uniref:NACHT domain-containing protein n=1 Tax=Svornostia abyssi TaxID=2898438 RepID=A0ABY5PBJ5_9ACTN|nr:NACHT domain-containing protein [Parviterribacteraceae bacterium J379]